MRCSGVLPTILMNSIPNALRKCGQTRSQRVRTAANSLAKPVCIVGPVRRQAIHIAHGDAGYPVQSGGYREITREWVPSDRISARYKQRAQTSKRRRSE